VFMPIVAVEPLPRGESIFSLRPQERQLHEGAVNCTKVPVCGSGPAVLSFRDGQSSPTKAACYRASR
jgi:hypothetical protein